MARGVGRSMAARLSLAPIARPGAVSPEGRRRGDTYYPSVLEAYNRDSDFSRWQRGQALYQSLGDRFGRQVSRLLLAQLVDDGTARTWQPLSTVRFPGGAADGAWTTCWSQRGALILPAPLLSSDISIDNTSPRSSQHRLIVDVSSSLTALQLEGLKAYIGRQFENGATGGRFPTDLTEPDDLTYAFTLVEVDATGGRLLFDLSRPFTRKRILGRAYWTKLPYRPNAPLGWAGDQGRYLISSDAFFCDCPDHSGRTVARLDGQGSSAERMPRPGAGAPPERINSAGLSTQQFAYSNQWRELPERLDQRRACKHIHALRWFAGVPFNEPSDYRSGVDFTSIRSQPVATGDIDRFNQLRGLSLDQAIQALAAVSGIDPDPVDTPAAGAVVHRDPSLRVLWTSPIEPDASWCQSGDWWLKRGSNELLIFDDQLAAFRATVADPPATSPVLRETDSQHDANATVLP